MRGRGGEARGSRAHEGWAFSGAQPHAGRLSSAHTICGRRTARFVIYIDLVRMAPCDGAWHPAYIAIFSDCKLLSTLFAGGR